MVWQNINSIRYNKKINYLNSQRLRLNAIYNKEIMLMQEYLSSKELSKKLIKKIKSHLPHLRNSQKSDFIIIENDINKIVKIMRH